MDCMLSFLPWNLFLIAHCNYLWLQKTHRRCFPISPKIFILDFFSVFLQHLINNPNWELILVLWGHMKVCFLQYICLLCFVQHITHMATWASTVDMCTQKRRSFIQLLIMWSVIALTPKDAVIFFNNTIKEISSPFMLLSLGARAPTLLFPLHTYCTPKFTLLLWNRLIYSSSDIIMWLQVH